eukprot:CAMPEP_0117471190 /NCGR_PEP_ID=MMETSP0784-20121206/7605_1 /TAXON_ID=39447 /ORGANISM="" /LENGTH=290 /DNA_ID=CAMNT_0005265305 /DNA_START=138 /DNA_END=1011 /DNA_ORIENTATION=-
MGKKAKPRRTESSALSRCIIVPGNGCTQPRRDNWYGQARKELLNRGIFEEVVLERMPDPHVARESYWVPFLRDQCGADENTVLIGHSSGAEAIMRLLEGTRSGPCVRMPQDLGDLNERASGYYSRPWDWTKIAGNARFILQFHSLDDPFIPVGEARYVASALQDGCAAHGADFEYVEHTSSSHFFSWATLGDAFLEKLQQKLALSPETGLDSPKAQREHDLKDRGERRQGCGLVRRVLEEEDDEDDLRYLSTCACCDDTGVLVGYGTCPLCDGLGLTGVVIMEKAVLDRP